MGCSLSALCLRQWSASTIAIIASPIGTKRGSRHGSWRPLVEIVVGAPLLVTVSWSCGIELVGLIAQRMTMGKPDEIPPVQKEVQKEVDAAEGKSWPMISIERYAFYERAKQAYCVIQTGERRFYGCFAFKKGVIPPEA